jgi:tetratricopeptide (TPR) repeat protein
MITPGDFKQSNRRLNSWKSIAAYFERDERTVKRWESQRGLPVHRVPGAGRSSVYAYTDELAGWLKAADTHAPLSLADDSSSEAFLTISAPMPAPASLPIVVTAPAAVTARPAEPAKGSKSYRGTILFVLAAAAVTFALASYVAYRRFESAHLTFASSRPAGLKHSVNPEAEELFLQGLYHWNKRTPESLNLALDDFTQSIVRDPNYAPAYAGLADCYNLMREFTLMPAKDAYPRAMAAAKRAIALDDTLSEAHNSLAFADFYWNWDATRAEHEFQRAIALDPNSVVAHHWYATFLSVLGRSKEALTEIENARKLDPQSSAILADKGLILFNAGQASQAVALLKQIETSDPSFLSPHSYLAIAYLRTHDDPAYLQEAKSAAKLLNNQNGLRIAAAGEKGLAQSGETGMLRAMLAVQKELYAKEQFSAYDLASTYCLLGEKEQALKLLTTAVTKREEQVIAIRSDVCFTSLHDDSAYRALVAQVGLPPFK